MARIKVHAGDFKVGHASYSSGIILIRGNENFFAKKIHKSQLVECEVASEESVKRLGGTIGWGIAGGVLLGPLGMLAGLLVGGKHKEVTFVARFADGRKLLATTDNKTFTEFMAVAFNRANGIATTATIKRRNSFLTTFFKFAFLAMCIFMSLVIVALIGTAFYR